MVPSLAAQIVGDGDRGDVLQVDLEAVVRRVVALPRLRSVQEPPKTSGDGERRLVEDLAVIHLAFRDAGKQSSVGRVPSRGVSLASKSAR
jgi:hypothetical protein